MKEQIEEMEIDNLVAFLWLKTNMCDEDLIFDVAEALVNAGYRKQSEGEWIKVYQNKISTVYECSRCKHLTLGTSDYCICGAKMKGADT